jgi:septum formation protein
MFRIILASESPRRKEIMNQMGIQYITMPANVTEEVKGDTPPSIVEALANLKSGEVGQRLKDERGDFIVIAADTMVFHHGQALGKPKDRDEAIKMIKALSGDFHEVFTGVSIIIKTNSDNNYNIEDEAISFSVGTQVLVQNMTMEQIEEYVDTGEPFDKAGGYGIQGRFGIYISEIRGDYYNVVGFPIAKIYEMLLSRNIDIKKLI